MKDLTLTEDGHDTGVLPLLIPKNRKLKLHCTV